MEIAAIAAVAGGCAFAAGFAAAGGAGGAVAGGAGPAADIHAAAPAADVHAAAPPLVAAAVDAAANDPPLACPWESKASVGDWDGEKRKAASDDERVDILKGTINSVFSLLHATTFCCVCVCVCVCKQIRSMEATWQSR